MKLVVRRSMGRRCAQTVGLLAVFSLGQFQFGRPGLAAQQEQRPCNSLAAALRVTISDDSGTIPIPGATVVLRWTDADAIRRPVRQDAGAGANLLLCAPKDATEATLWAEFGDASSLESVVNLEPGVLTEVELRLRLGSVKTGRIVGQIRDVMTDDPVSAAAVSVIGRENVVATNRRGRFVLSGVPVGEHELTVQHIGYGHLVHRVPVNRGVTTDIEVGLVPDPLEMEPLVATATRPRRLEIRGFYERKYWGELVAGGTFFTAADIERRNPSLISHMIADMPGVFIGDCGIRHDECLLLSSRLSTGFSDEGCPLTIYLDGSRLMPRPDRRIQGVSIDEYVRPVEVAGMELYGGASSVPGEFAGSTARCGVAVIWTR